MGGVAQPDLGNQAVGLVMIGALPAKGCTKFDIFAHRPPWQQQVLLCHIGNAGFKRQPIRTGDVTANIAFDQIGEKAQKRAFAHTTWPEQAGETACRQVKIKVMENIDAAKCHAGRTQVNIELGWIGCRSGLGCRVGHTILPTPVLTGSGSKGRLATPNLSADLRSAPPEMTGLCAVKPGASRIVKNRSGHV